MSTDQPPSRGSRLLTLAYYALVIWLMWPRHGTDAPLRARLLKVGIWSTSRLARWSRDASDRLIEAYGREVEP